MELRDRIDPESRAALDRVLASLPSDPDDRGTIIDRRDAFEALVTQLVGELPPNDRVDFIDRRIAGLDDDPSVRVRVYRPVVAAGTLPGLVYIHGGGMCTGSIATEHVGATALCETIGCVVVSVDYRLAPEHPYPAQLRDCSATLRWVAAHCDELGVDPGRVALYGGSAGGGLAIATALSARDLGGPSVRFVLAAAPMLDDRNETPSSHEITGLGMWDRAANIEAWAWYLGGRPADAYAAPARAADLSGLPPMFIDVGELDLFRDEDVEFAGRLLRAGVSTELHVYAGAFHGSEALAPDAALSQRIARTRLDALRRALA